MVLSNIFFTRFKSFFFYICLTILETKGFFITTWYWWVQYLDNTIFFTNTSSVYVIGSGLWELVARAILNFNCYLGLVVPKGYILCINSIFIAWKINKTKEPERKIKNKTKGSSCRYFVIFNLVISLNVYKLLTGRVNGNQVQTPYHYHHVMWRAKVVEQIH